jgi:hypothetical protein
MVSWSKNNLFSINSLFPSPCISLIGLNLLINTGIKAIDKTIPGNAYSLTERERSIPVKNDKRVPTEAVQIIVKIAQGIKMIARYTGSKARITPIRVATPLPPRKLRKIDQL